MLRLEKLVHFSITFSKVLRRKVPLSFLQSTAAAHSQNPPTADNKTCKSLTPTDPLEARGPACPCPKYIVCLKERPIKCPELECPPDLTNTIRFYQVTAIAASLLSAILFYDFIKKLIEESKVDPSPKKKTNKRPRKHPRPVIRFPVRSEIPNEVPYLIIGGGTAAHSAAKTILKEDPTSKVVIVTDEPYLPYMRPPLSKEMIYTYDREGAMLDFAYVHRKTFQETSAYLEKAEFYANKEKLEEEGGLMVAYGWPVVEIDANGNVVTLQDGSEIKYEKCLLATGAKPKKLNFMKIEDPELFERISLYRGGFDFLDLEESIKYGARDIAVVGGGLIGTELLGSLLVRGRSEPNLKVTQILRGETILPSILPKYLGQWAMKQLVGKGANFIKNVCVEDITVKGDTQVELYLTNNERTDADYAVIAVGVDPNTDLAGSSKLEVDCKTKAFVANAELQIRKDLFGAGDNISFFDTKTGCRVAIQHHMHAVETGRIAALNMMGAHNIFENTLMYGSSIGDMINFDVIGEVNAQLATVGIFVGTAGDVVEKETASQEEEDAGEDDEIARAAEELAKCLQKALGESAAEKAGKLADKYMEDAEEMAKEGEKIIAPAKVQADEVIKSKEVGLKARAKNAFNKYLKKGKTPVTEVSNTTEKTPVTEVSNKNEKTPVTEVSNKTEKTPVTEVSNKAEPKNMEAVNINKTPAPPTVYTTEQGPTPEGFEDLLAPAEISKEYMKMVDAQNISFEEEEEEEEDYSKGVVFYLKNDVVVGVVTWNLPNRGPVAKSVLENGTKYNELNSTVKMFKMHM